MKKCPSCGSTETVMHAEDHPLKPGFLHCNACGFCGSTAQAPAKETAPVEPEPEAASEEPAEETAPRGRRG